MSQREKIIFGLGAVGLILVVALVGGVVYALLKASVTTLRWWAGLATLAIPVTAALAWWLATREARARLAGIDQGIERVAKAAAATVSVAERAAQVRVGVAQSLRQRPQPAVQQVFLPGLTAGAPVIRPVLPDGEEVEL